MSCVILPVLELLPIQLFGPGAIRHEQQCAIVSREIREVKVEIVRFLCAHLPNTNTCDGVVVRFPFDSPVAAGIRSCKQRGQQHRNSQSHPGSPNITGDFQTRSS